MRQQGSHGFEHEALLYGGDDEFVDRTAAFVRAGVEAGEPVMVMVGARKIDRLRAELGEHAGAVRFEDMEVAGRNPARIIPAWRGFAKEHAAPGVTMRGVGEPIWSGRSADELVECQTHESLLNRAFSDTGGFRLLCPYDITALDASVIEEARRSHPVVSDGDVRWSSTSYSEDECFVAGLAKPLPAAPGDARELAFGIEELSALRAFVAVECGDAGLDDQRGYDLALAVSEVAANSVRHGGGRGSLVVWREPDALVCEVRDSGRIEDPLAGRVAPPLDLGGGHGLWLANRMCDLLQIRSSDEGTVVRLQVRRAT